MYQKFSSTYGESFPSHGTQPKSRSYKPIEQNRVPTFDPRHVPSKNWRSETSAHNGIFDMEYAINNRARSAPAGIRWAPRKLLGPDWTTKNWSTSYRTGCGLSPRQFTEVTQEELSRNLEASVVKNQPHTCPYPKTAIQVKMQSTASDIGTWDLTYGNESKKEYKKIQKFDRSLSESWFIDANKPPGLKSTYGGMTDPTQIDDTIFKIHNEGKLTREEQKKLSHLQWLMTHEKSRYAYRKLRRNGGSMSDTWLGQYCPQLPPPTPPRLPNRLRKASPVNRRKKPRRDNVEMEPAGKKEESGGTAYNILAHSDTALVQATPLILGAVESEENEFPTGTLLDATTQRGTKQRIIETPPIGETSMRRSYFTKFPCPIKKIGLDVEKVRAEMRAAKKEEEGSMVRAQTCIPAIRAK